MRSFRKTARHETAIAQRNAVLAEDMADYAEGDRVMTVDGFPGRVTGVLFGAYANSESYQVELDGGMGGGDYSPGQLSPLRQNTASKVEAADVYASIPVEAVTDHTANVDYPELEDILERRLPNENIKIYAAVNKDDQAAEPDITGDDPGEKAEQDKSNVAEPDSKPVDDPNSDPEVDPAELAQETQDAKLGDVTPPDACSYCGGASFGDPQMTGRGVRMRCDQCNGTMTSWGGQWQPEFPNSSQNKASETWDYRSGGPGGIGQAPGGQPFSTDPAAAGDPAKPEEDEDDGKTIKVKISSIAKSMTNNEIAESLQAEAGIVQYLFNKMYDRARKHYEQSQVEWWRPPADEIRTDIQGPAQYTPTVTPRQVSVGSVSEYNDPNWLWHFTASWMDVQAKARKIRKENHVKIVAASKTFVTAEVLGDRATYETQLNYVPGTRKVADWACGCKWASYAWGRSARYRRFEGRLCSHALATQYEAASRGIFGRDVQLDTVRPDWQKAHSPVVVNYDKAQEKDLTRRAVPPANMKRTFSSLLIDSDGVYPLPHLLDLAHPPVYASVQTMIDNQADLPDVIEMLASVGVTKDDARSMLFEALLSPADPEGYLGHPGDPESGSAWTTEASKQHHKRRNEDGPRWAWPYGFGWGICGGCGGTGCGNCNMSGQVPDNDAIPGTGDNDADDAGGGGGALAGGDAGGGGATASISDTHAEAFDYGHTMGYDYADRLQHHNDGFADPHPGEEADEKRHHMNSWFDQEHRFHVEDGWDHGVATYNNEHEKGLPHRGGMRVSADYSTADPLVGLDAGHNIRPTVQHSNSQNPASTGWATGQDPNDWGRSLISNDFGVTFDAALHTADNDGYMSDAALDFQSRLMEGTLNDQPEAALPTTDGASEEVDPSPAAGDTVDGIHGERPFDTTAAIIADFQRTAGGRALAKEAMKDFSFEEQQELINEGKGDRARNFSDLRIAGTHYELLGDDMDDETILWV